MSPQEKEDLTQTCLLGVVEGVRLAQGVGHEFSGPLRDAWDRRVLARVDKELNADREKRERNKHDNDQEQN
jgi:hypothetical protein